MNNKLISKSILLFALCAPVLLSAQNTFPSTGNVGIGTTSPGEKLDVRGNIRLSDNTLYFRGVGDNNHGVAYRGVNPFAGQNIDGPVAFGWNGGALGSTNAGEKIALRWNEQGNIAIGANTFSEKLSVTNGKLSVETTSAYGNYKLKIGSYSIDTKDPSGREGGLLLNFNTNEPVIVGDWTKTTDTYLRVAGYIEARKVNIGGNSYVSNSLIAAGDPNADYKLAVNGKIVAKSIYATVSGWGDFVFEENYNRMNWAQKRDFLATNKHLPGVEKADRIEKYGVNLSETLKHVTINVEENSLDIIDLYQRLEKLESENLQLKKELMNFKDKAGN